MQREIKFRCYCKKRKRMYKVLHLHVDSEMTQGIWATVQGFSVKEDKPVHLQVQPKDAVVMQFTGLKDKNGVEIYEEDIVQYIDNPTGIYTARYEVIIDGGYIGLTRHDLPLYNIEPHIWVEIIGNIHQSPELLNTPNSTPNQ